MVKSRTYSAAFKAQVVLEIISGAKSQGEVAREHRIKPDILARWKRQFLEKVSNIPACGYRCRRRDARRLRGLPSPAARRSRCTVEAETTMSWRSASSSVKWQSL